MRVLILLLALASPPADVPQQPKPHYHATCRRHGAVERFTWRRIVRSRLAMRFADGVKLQVVSGVAEALPTLDSVHIAVVRREAVVTSARDHKHIRGSAHYCGRALDLRTRDLPRERIAPLVEALKRALGDAWTVLNEDTHLHLQYRRH